MKKILILFILLVTLLMWHCEDMLTWKVKRHNEFDRRRIEHVEIIDTIYYEDVQKYLIKDTTELGIEKRELNAIHKMIPNIRANHLFDKEKTKNFFKMMEKTERRVEIIEGRIKEYEHFIWTSESGDIYAFVILLNNKNLTEEYYMDKDYRLMGPSFLYKLDY